MTGPLVDPREAPEWLRGLVTRSGELDAWTFTRFAAPEGSRVKAASVLMLFGEDDNDAAGPDVLLLRRADTLGSHAGQVAFPGGGAEDGDDGPVATALREAEEETGVDPSGVLPLAVLPELFVPVSSFSVTPVLAYWRRSSPVHAVDPRETAAVARVPVAELVDPANRYLVRRKDKTSDWRGPVFDVRGLFVWGFTAGLLSVLLRLAGWERPWDHTDVRDLDVALARHEARVRSAEPDGRE